MQLFGNSEWLILMTAIIWACGDKQMETIKRVRLSEIAELITKGTTPTTWGYNFQEDGVNFLKIECFSEDGTYIKEKTAHISEECHEKLKRSKLRTGDILFSIAGAIGRVAVVTEEMLPANTNQALAIIRVTRDDIYLPYIKLILTSQIVKAQFERKKQGVAQLNISLKDINELEIPLPEKSKQIECASLLEKISGIITARQQQLQKLDDLVKARFVELFGDPMTNSKGYVLKKYGDLFELNAGGTPSRQKTEYWDNGTISWIGSNMCQNTVIYENDGNYITEEGLKHSSARMFPVDTVLIALVGATIGKTALLKFETTTNQNVLGVRGIRENGYTPEFLFYYTQGLYQKFLSIGDGGFSMASKGFISELPVPVVDLALQEQFSSFVEQTDKSKLTVQQSLDKLELLKKALMQKYFA